MDYDASELSQAVTLLNLSTDSGFYTDWKQAYLLDTEQCILNTYPTDTIMHSITRLVSDLSVRFQLSHSIEFCTMDTLEQLLIKIIAGAPSAPTRSHFLEQAPLYVVTVLNLVSKQFDARSSLDRQLMQQMILKGDPKLVWSDQRMMQLEFDVLKSLNYKVSHSLLLGAVERFSKDYILTLGIARKDHVGAVGVKLLRVVYAQKYHIYNSLRSDVKSEDMFRRFKSNKLILAAAIITAMLKLCNVDQEEVLNHVVTPLSNECFVEPKNIIFLRDAILSVFN